MAVKRVTRKFTEIVDEVRTQIIANGIATQKELDTWAERAQASEHSFPHSLMIDIEDLWIDYEVQRDVIYKHVVNIMKKWDPRICSPGSACRIGDDTRVFLYDAQHRSLAAALLGFTSVPGAIVLTYDPNFASYAFEMLNDTGVKRLTPGDLHRNYLVRFKNGSRDIKVVRARTLQDQFDKARIDLQDKNSRKSATLCGDNEYFFSHFKYAYKAIEVDETGNTLFEIIDSIATVFDKQDEIDQGLFIGLYELYRLVKTNPSITLPEGWMIKLLKSVKKSFKSSHVVHNKAKIQWEHTHPGAGWNAPLAMSNFLREVHIYNKGKLNLPYHGEGSKVGIEEGFVAKGLFGAEA